jgi:hypothetical protein
MKVSRATLNLAAFFLERREENFLLPNDVAFQAGLEFVE